VLPFAKDLPVSLIDVRNNGAIGARILVDPAPHAARPRVHRQTHDLRHLCPGVLAGAWPATCVSITSEQT